MNLTTRRWRRHPRARRLSRHIGPRRSSGRRWTPHHRRRRHHRPLPKLRRELPWRKWSELLRRCHWRHTWSSHQGLRWRSHSRRRLLRVVDRRTRDLRLHHSRSGPTNTTNRTSKSGLGLNQRPSRNPSPSATTNTGPGNAICSSSCLDTGFIGRRRTLNSHGDNFFATEEEKAESAAILALFFRALSRWKLPELLAISENEVHVAIESHEFSDQLTAVLDRDPHPIIDVLKHLGSFGHRHLGWIRKRRPAKVPPGKWGFKRRPEIGRAHV